MQTALHETVDDISLPFGVYAIWPCVFYYIFGKYDDSTNISSLNREKFVQNIVIFRGLRYTDLGFLLGS